MHALCGTVAHVGIVDTCLNDSRRTISGALKLTPRAWLPVMSGIAPPHIRRDAAKQKKHRQILELTPQNCTRRIAESAPHTSRLSSRNPFYKCFNPDFDLEHTWRDEWAQTTPLGGEYVRDPCEPLPGFHTKSKRQWTLANRIRSGHGRTAHNLHRWGYVESALCPYRQEDSQDMNRIVLHCPTTRIHTWGLLNCS